MESGAAPGSRELPTLPICQICGLDLTNARTFFRRYRICEAHAAEKEQIVDGLTQRFCQQCGRFHTLDAFDADQKSCREELARHAARRRDLRRRRKASQGLAAVAAGGAPTSSGRDSPADLAELLAAAAQAEDHGQHSRHHHHGRSSRRRSGDPYRRVMVTGRHGMVAPGAAASPWAAASAAGQQLPEPGAELALAPTAGAQELPLQRSAPAGQPMTGWSASEAQALLNTLSAGMKPAASSGLLSSTTAAHLDVTNMAALSAALAGQAASLPGLALGLSALTPMPQPGSAALALGNAASDAASGSGEHQTGLPPLLGATPAGAAGTASTMAGLLQQLLRPPHVQIPSVRSVPLPLPQQVSLLPSAATAAPVHDPQLSAPVPGMHSRDGGAPAPATGGPVCQVCRSSLADMLPFYKRYRVCAEHMAAREVLREGVPSRFCQQCGRFHPLDAFDGTQRTCREELAWRRYRRTHGGKDAHGEGRVRRHHKQQLMQQAAAGAAHPAKQGQRVERQPQAAHQQAEQQQQQQQQHQQQQSGIGASPPPLAEAPVYASELAQQPSDLFGRQLPLPFDAEQAPAPFMGALPAAKRPRLDAPADLPPGQEQAAAAEPEAHAAVQSSKQQEQQQTQPVKDEQMINTQPDLRQAEALRQSAGAFQEGEGQGSASMKQPQPQQPQLQGAAAPARASKLAQQQEQQPAVGSLEPLQLKSAGSTPRGPKGGLAALRLPLKQLAEAPHTSMPRSPASGAAPAWSPSAAAHRRSPASAAPPAAVQYPGLAALAQLAAQAQESAASQPPSGALAGLPAGPNPPPSIAQLMQLAQPSQQPPAQHMAALLAQLQQTSSQPPELAPLFAAALQQVEAQQQEAQLAQQLAAAVAQLTPQQAPAGQPSLLQSALLQQVLGQAANPQAALLQQVLGQAANPQANLLQQVLGQVQQPPPALLQQLLATAQPQGSQPQLSPLQQALEALTGGSRQPPLLPQPPADAGPMELLMQLSQLPAPPQAPPPPRPPPQPQQQSQPGGSDSAELLLQFSQLAPHQQAALLALARSQPPSSGGR